MDKYPVLGDKQPSICDLQISQPGLGKKKKKFSPKVFDYSMISQ